MKNWFKNIFKSKPRLSDLPRAERRRIKALMLGACAGGGINGGFYTKEDLEDERKSETGAG